MAVSKRNDLPLRNRPSPLVEVEWEDAHLDPTGQFLLPEEIEEDVIPTICFNVGYMVVSNGDEVVLAGSRHREHLENAVLYRDTMRIPRGMVRKVRRLK